MTDKELIKQEIESYKESMKRLEPHSDFRRGQITAFNQIMQFIDSIPEESCCEANFTAKAEYNKIKELSLEMGEEGSFGYSHAFSILSKLNEWQKQAMKETLQTEYEKGRFAMKEEMMKMAEDTAGLSLSWGKDSKMKIIIIEEEQQ
jgi:hypothetical protein